MSISIQNGQHRPERRMEMAVRHEGNDQIIFYGTDECGRRHDMAMATELDDGKIMITVAASLDPTRFHTSRPKIEPKTINEDREDRGLAMLPGPLKHDKLVPIKDLCQQLGVSAHHIMNYTKGPHGIQYVRIGRSPHTSIAAIAKYCGVPADCRLFQEQLVNFEQAARKANTTRHLLKAGTNFRPAPLEHIRIGARWLTSHAAVERHLRAKNEMLKEGDACHPQTP